MAFDFITKEKFSAIETFALAEAADVDAARAAGTAGDPRPGIEARVHDPLWLLGRQWQLGEFEGEDAGTPLTVRVVTRTAPSTAGRPARTDRTPTTSQCGRSAARHRICSSRSSSASRSRCRRPGLRAARGGRRGAARGARRRRAGRAPRDDRRALPARSQPARRIPAAATARARPAVAAARAAARRRGDGRRRALLRRRSKRPRRIAAVARAGRRGRARRARAR